MGERNFQKKQRDLVNRRRKPVMVISAEGNNKTEQLYFTSFQNQHGKYSLKFVKTSKDTDPAGLQKSMETYWSNNELSAREGDKAYIVVDLDCSEQKAKVIEDLSRKAKHVKFIVSNPCVEVWFLLHYNYSTHQFLDGKAVKREMRKHIQSYDESMDVAAVLRPMLSNALANAERLKKYYAELGSKWISTACNPRTDVPEIIRELGVE